MDKRRLGQRLRRGLDEKNNFEHFFSIQAHLEMGWIGISGPYSKTDLFFWLLRWRQILLLCYLDITLLLSSVYNNALGDHRKPQEPQSPCCRAKSHFTVKCPNLQQRSGCWNSVLLYLMPNSFLNLSRKIVKWSQLMHQGLHFLYCGTNECQRVRVLSCATPLVSNTLWIRFFCCSKHKRRSTQAL